MRRGSTFARSSGLLAGACLLVATLPATAHAQTVAPAAASSQLTAGRSASQFDGISAFYSWRRNAPFWLNNGAVTPAVTQLLNILKRAPIEGLADGSQLAAEAEAAIGAAQGDPVKTLYADRLLSSAWARYVQTIRAPAPGVEIGMPYFAPRPVRADEVMYEAARAPSLEQYLQTVSDVNPIYARLRDAALAQFGVGAPDPRVVASLERSRILPATGRFVMVDAASQRLFIVEDGQIKDTMKVVVGMFEDAVTHKPTPHLQTPMIVSMIYYATFNPYWHVPTHLVPNIAKGVVKAGPAALKGNRYQVVNAFVENAIVLDPATIDWKGVAAGTKTISLRQLPGPNNSMGLLKFQFPNATGIYLHDTPRKDYFLKADRTLSNGCIRLEDAKRLGRWLLGRDPVPPSKEPEQHVQLPQGVPVYVTYLTARLDGDKIAFAKDVYKRDFIAAPKVASAVQNLGAASQGQPR